MSEEQLQFSVLTVNYNAGAFVGAAVDSVLAQVGVRVEMIVVDNASTDDSRVRLEAYAGAIRCIWSDENLGFGRANNLAAASARGRYLLLLNPDAELEDFDALRRAFERLEGAPEVGLAGTRLLNLDGSVQALPRKAYPGQRHASEDFGRLPGDIAWVVGASVIVPRAVFAQVGGFDEDFFLYGEETDLCLRIRRAGYEIGYLEDVSVLHVDAVSEREQPLYEVWMRKQTGLHVFYRKAYGDVVARRLVRRELYRARYRLSLIGAKKAVALESPEDEGKHAKYRAMRDRALQTLREFGGP